MTTKKKTIPRLSNEKIKEIAPLFSEAITHQRRIRELVEEIERIVVGTVPDVESFAYEMITELIIEVAYQDTSDNALVHARELVMRTSR